MTQATLRFARTLSAWLLISAALPAAATAAADSERFKSIYEAEWAFRLREFPMYASYVGVAWDT
jgi:hypothetical protein